MSSQNKDVYVSINPRAYVQNKTAILESQVHFLKSLKHLHNLKILSKQKKDLRESLYKQFEAVIKQVNKIEDKFPKPTIPKNYKRKKNKKQREVEKLDMDIRKNYSRKDEIDKELIAIKMKLAALND